ncbi:hypothetical protein TNCV_3319761 [Trichonephila clavipes]|nr:hypothetical protein TNCV_3319761 [Trichonephila clavipes]
MTHFPSLVGDRESQVVMVTNYWLALPQKIQRVERLMHYKSVESQNPHVIVKWKFDERDHLTKILYFESISNIPHVVLDKYYEEEFVRAQLSVISEERVERETEEKIARQHAIQQLRWESELNELRLEIESIRSNVKRTSCAEDRKKTSSNYRISIERAGEHMRETSPAVLMAKATIPVTTPIKEENGMDDLRVVYVKVKGEQEMVNAVMVVMPRCPWHGVVPVSKNLANDMLICSSDYEVLIENSQMIRNPAKLREPSKEEGIISSTDSKSVCSQEVITNLRPETYTQSLLNVPNRDLVAVKINASDVQTNGQVSFQLHRPGMTDELFKGGGPLTPAKGDG